jgi:O-acetylserine/cysteine efflux transporter
MPTPSPSSLRPRDLALALLVIVVWGVNFAVIKVGLGSMPPLLLAALRFVLAAFPALLFLPAPRLPLRLYLAYGLTMSVGQFGFLFTAIHLGMPSGLASLVLQSQAVFTMLLAALWLHEGWRANQLAGLVLGGAGLLLIGSAHGAAMPLAGFALTVAAAAMWACGNIVSRAISRHGAVNPLAFVVWASLVPPLPLLALSLLIDGPAALPRALHAFDLRGFAAVAYIAWAATLLGYGIWNHLLARHPVNRVAPFTLLVPLVGLTTGWLAFGETLRPVHLAGGALLMAGLALNLFGARLFRRRASPA